MKDSLTIRNGNGLLGSVFERGGEYAYAAACDLWDLLQMPDPAQREFYRGTDADHVFLNPFGLTISFRYRDTDLFGSERIYAARTVHHDHILQPLIQIDLGEKCCFEILPGIQTYQKTDNGILESLSRVFTADGLRFGDKQMENVGLIRIALGEAIPVVLDRGAVTCASTYTPQEDPLQTQLYKPLREQATQAFGSASTADIMTFKETCLRISALDAQDPSKILFKGWDAPAPFSAKANEIAQAARAYERRFAP